MCGFISWIEREGEVLFLTANDVESAHDRQTLEDCLESDFLSCWAIRRFHGLSLSDGTNQENRNFWNGKLPQKIKDAWNAGELDGMMRYLQGNDLGYIVPNAPVEFVAWTIAQKYGKNYASMMQDNDWQVRLAGMVATQNYAAMKQDYVWPIQLMGMVATQDYEAMMEDSYWAIQLVGMVATQDYEAMMEDSYWAIQLVGMAAIQHYDTMKQDDDWQVRLAGMIATQDYKAMKKDVCWTVRLMGMAATYDPEKLVRPRL